MKEAQDSYQKSLDIYLRLYGGSHGCVALALLCLARLPDIHRTTLDALALYDRVLKVIDPANRPVQEILKEIPEVPSEAHFLQLVKGLYLFQMGLSGRFF